MPGFFSRLMGGSDAPRSLYERWDLKRYFLDVPLPPDEVIEAAWEIHSADMEAKLGDGRERLERLAHQQYHHLVWLRDDIGAVPAYFTNDQLYLIALRALLPSSRAK